jgi:hypothetical protein
MDQKLGLNRLELIYFTAQSIAAGEWEKLKLDRETAFGLLRSFCGKVLPDGIEPDVFAGSIYHTVQSAMLARRGFDFETLQLFPPFSEFGRRNLTQLLTFYRAKGDEALENAFRRMFREGWETRRPPEEIVETPVRFSTDDLEKRIRAEYWFVAFTYGKEDEQWKRGVHFTIAQPRTYSMISQWSITLKDGRAVNVYFDTNRDR